MSDDGPSAGESGASVSERIAQIETATVLERLRLRLPGRIGRRTRCSPANWSSTTSPGAVQSSSASAIRAVGFTVGWTASAAILSLPNVLAPA